MESILMVLVGCSGGGGSCFVVGLPDEIGRKPTIHEVAVSGGTPHFCDPHI